MFSSLLETAMKRIALALLAIAALPACAPRKHIDGAVMARCPVCQEEFVGHVPPGPAAGGAGSGHGLMPRYLSEPRERSGIATAGYFPGAERIFTCPHCLYSAAEPTFGGIDPGEKARIGHALAALSFPAEGEQREIDIARICETERSPDARRALDLELHAYFLPGHERTMEDRRQLRASIVRALRAGPASDHDRARLTYLAGEVTHQMGEASDARRLLAAASRIARSLDAASPEGGTGDDVRWVTGWSAAQLRRIEMQSRTAGDLASLAQAARPMTPGDGRWPPPGDAEIAVQVLAGRDDREAWAVLESFAGGDAEKLHDLVRITDLDPERMRLAPGLHALAEDRYLRHDDALLREAVFEKGRKGPRLDPEALERFEAELAEGAPASGTRDAVIDALPSLIEDGNEQAARCLVGLVAHPGDARTDYRIGESIEALARTPDLWPLVQRSLPPLTPEADWRQLLLAVAARAWSGLSPRLVARLEERPPLEERHVILGVLGAMGDRAAIPFALEFSTERPDDWSCLDYLSKVGGLEDAIEIARMARWTERATDQWALEDCLRNIRIRLATRAEAPSDSSTAEAPR
jgi:hypothetical protein